MHRLVTLALAVVVLASMSHSRSPSPRVVVFPPAPQPLVVAAAPPASVLVPVPMPLPLPFAAAPAAAPAAAADPLGPCPAPYRRGSTVPVTTPPDRFDPTAITLSDRDVRLMAVWNNEAVMLSTDEGRSWRRVLDGDGRIGDAAFDCHGRLHVVRGDGMLGTHDDGTAPAETWTRAAALDDSEADWVVLLPDGTGVAVAGVDAAAPTHLVLARRDHRGRWRTAALYHDDNYLSWDGVQIEEVEHLGGDRFRLFIYPWSGGECGYSEYRDVYFDLGLRNVREVEYDEERPAKYADESPPLDHYDTPVRDAAGRWVLLADRPVHDDDRHPPILRLTAAELRERLAERTSHDPAEGD